MPTSIYCTYITIYTGNKLPPFYIGSTSTDKINKGYRGSVKSQKYQSIWKQEITSHPDLFKTIILTRHETRQEALDKEIIFHESLSVARNPIYINMAHANGKFFSSEGNPGTRSPETKAKMSAAKTGKKRGPQSPEHIAKAAAAKRTPEARAKQSAARTGKKQSPEHIAKRVAARTGQKHTPESILADDPSSQHS